LTNHYKKTLLWIQHSFVSAAFIDYFIDFKSLGPGHKTAKHQREYQVTEVPTQDEEDDGSLG
jgi:hypothetical protein